MHCKCLPNHLVQAQNSNVTAGYCDEHCLNFVNPGAELGAGRCKRVVYPLVGQGQLPFCVCKIHRCTLQLFVCLLSLHMPVRIPCARQVANLCLIVLYGINSTSKQRYKHINLHLLRL